VTAIIASAPRRWSVASTVFLVAATLSSAYAAGDVKAGRQKALQCQACHGMDGTAKIPEAPNLAGQSEVYLVKSLQDYRKNEMMSIVIQSLKDQDIADLAAYFAAIPVTVGEPPR
jgi:cytochrome c553